MIKLRKVLIVSAMATTSLTGSPLAARAAAEVESDEQQRKLEARVEELERQLHELTQKMSVAPARAATQATVDGAIVQPRPITPNAMAGTRFIYSGFVKLDALWSDYRDGEIADGSIGRDFYLPSTVPVGGVGEGIDFDSHIKQSRFVFGTDTDLPGGLLSSRLEVDLYGSALGDERATNTYGLQVRHAYIQYGRWLAGQTWSNFMDATTLPETADFIGPTDGTVFVREPMVRYTLGNWSFSAENPETTITPFGGGTRIASDDNNIPDFTAAYTWKLGSRGFVRAAGLVRQLKYETTGVGAISDSTQGAAISLAGRINFGRDDLRFSITGGEGLGRYVGVNFANDAVLTADRELKAISGWAAFAAWRHVWHEQVRSTLMLSASDYDNEVQLTGGGANKSSWSWAFNTFYSPLTKLDLGVELRVAEREIESGASGSMRRVQAVARYSF
jgi:hypothetical protein